MGTMRRKKDNCVIDSLTQTMRCEKCGDEVPIPLGLVAWVCAVMRAFSAAHAGSEPHAKGRTAFSVPTHENKRSDDAKQG